MGHVWVVFLFFFAACGTAACPQDDVHLEESSPRIDSLRLHGTVEDDPWELVFVVDFRDSDGDLGRGKAHAYLNGGDEPLSMELTDVFRQSALAFDSTGGTLQIPLRFNSVSNSGNVLFGLQLEDEAKHLSNCSSLDLHFDVQSVAQLLRTKARMLWQSYWSEEGHHG